MNEDGQKQEAQTPMEIRWIRTVGTTGVVAVIIWRGLTDPRYLAAAGPEWLFWCLVALLSMAAIVNWVDLIRALSCARKIARDSRLTKHYTGRECSR